jgi:hypothetical protein
MIIVAFGYCTLQVQKDVTSFLVPAHSKVGKIMEKTWRHGWKLLNVAVVQHHLLRACWDNRNMAIGCVAMETMTLLQLRLFSMIP